MEGETERWREQERNERKRERNIGIVLNVYCTFMKLQCHNDIHDDNNTKGCGWGGATYLDHIVPEGIDDIV